MVKSPVFRKTKNAQSSKQVVNDPLLLAQEDRYSQLHRQICLFLKEMLFKTISIRHMEKTSPYRLIRNLEVAFSSFYNISSCCYTVL